MYHIVKMKKKKKTQNKPANKQNTLFRKSVRTLDTSLGAINGWELLKHKVKDFSVYFAKYKCKTLRDNTKLFENQINFLETGWTEQLISTKITRKLDYICFMVKK